MCAPKYILSCISRMQQGSDPSQVPIESVGSSWSQQGHDAFNDFYDLVTKDREERGSTFNMDLWRYYSEEKRRKDLHRITKRNKKTKVPTNNYLKVTQKCATQDHVTI